MCNLEGRVVIIDSQWLREGIDGFESEFYVLFLRDLEVIVDGFGSKVCE